jgi:hypothetical protein
MEVVGRDAGCSIGLGRRCNDHLDVSTTLATYPIAHRDPPLAPHVLAPVAPRSLESVEKRTCLIPSLLRPPPSLPSPPPPTALERQCTARSCPDPLATNDVDWNPRRLDIIVSFRDIAGECDRLFVTRVPSKEEWELWEGARGA